MSGMAFAGVGLPNEGIWRWWQVSGEIDDNREAAARRIIAETRRIATLHHLPNKYVLVTPLPEGANDPHNAVPLAVLCANIGIAVQQNETKAVMQGINAVRVMIRRHFFWMEVTKRRGGWHEVGFHILPSNINTAMMAFTECQTAAQHKRLLVAAE